MKTPIDLSKFETITSHIKTPLMERVCGVIKEEERVKTITHVILEIANEKHAKILAEYIVNLQEKLKECEKRK